VILQSATSQRFYDIYVKDTGLVSVKRVYVPADRVTPVRDRTIINDERTKAFIFSIKDTDLANPLIILSRHENIHIGRAYLLLNSPNGREWEVTCRGEGTYKIKGLSLDWSRMAAPVLLDPAGLPWRFEANAAGEFQVTQDAGEIHRRRAFLKSLDGTTAWEITVDTDGILSVTDTALANAPYSDAELIAPDGTRWLLRVDSSGVLYLSDEWQATRNGDEWPLLLAGRGGLLYVVDARFPPPFGNSRRGRRAA
jgi:hypothetical protein